ncbi:SLC13 family permease [Halobacteriaceae archaeon GCM10025711]
MALPAATPEMLLVFGIIVAAVALFIAEPVPNDITAIGVLVVLVALGDLTQISVPEALSGFSNPATITIVAMYVLSDGIQRTGLVELLGSRLDEFTNGSEFRLLAATVGVAGPTAGIINNTPVVAVLIPMVQDLARKSQISPSKLLIPLSYAAMFGGTLTLVGTATNILASDLSAELIGHPFSMFEFTHLGVIVLVAGTVYLLTVGRWLLPERISPTASIPEEFRVNDFLARVLVRRRSPLVGRTVDEALSEELVDVDIIEIIRGEDTFLAPRSDREIQAGDILTVRANQPRLERFIKNQRLRFLPRAEVTAAEFESPGRDGTLVEVVVPAESSLVGETIAESHLGERYQAVVLALRHRGGEPVHSGLSDEIIRPGDSLLLQTTSTTSKFLARSSDVVVTEEIAPEAIETDNGPPTLSPQTPYAVAILAGVILTAALGVVPIVVSALAGIVAMAATGCIRPRHAYDAVSWNVVFLLAGVIPLGIALQETGGAAFIASLLVDTAAVIPAVALLALFYLLTGLLANVITPVASVVLMLPVAVDTATRIGLEPFPFVLAVTFAASTAFMTPVGYQTNLMVYGPGGYKFSDYIRVGAPLQLLFTVVTTLGIVAFWPLR